uniref:KHA domain-containing protein n=1 Tax=Strigamia maritima TaxID=126957 RepID=T1JJI6_STRMM
MRRVILFRNGTEIDGKVFLVTHSLEELLTGATNKFGVNIKRIFTAQGGEIDDIRLIKDDDILYASEGEPFIKLQKSQRFQDINSLTPLAAHHGWISLNIGGRKFVTTRSTLTTKDPGSMLARMFADVNDSNQLWLNITDKHGAYLIDRNPTYFEPILNYLRHGRLILNNNINPEGVLEEAKFFGIDSLISLLEEIVQEKNSTPDCLPLSRRDVINALVSTSHSSELRFQGVNLTGADLSRLDLRNINFKYANLQKTKLVGANLAFCCLERADLSHANLEGANLMGVKMLCANLELSNMLSCNFEDPAGSRANMEGVNLKGANLEGSQMAAVNLRVATLKNANLQNCDLRGAVLAGADLENCDLSGSDLHEANLRGANLKDAAFELMLTPLHMSQTIR